MWNGTAPSLNAIPATMKITPNISTASSVPPLLTALYTSARSSEPPVAPYSIEIPYSTKPEASAPST